MHPDPITINPRDVLEYLNGLGYTNITGPQLKEFIKDLKKLIKHDLQKKVRNASGQENIFANSTSRTEDEEFKESKAQLSSVHCPSEIRSNYKLVSNKHGRQISVLIHKQPQHISHFHCTHIDKSDTNITPASNRNCNELHLNLPKNISSEGSRSEYATNSTVKAVHFGSKPTLPSKPSSDTSKSRYSKPTRSFMRPPSYKIPCLQKKSDPVTLYHYYQSLWKNAKIPGEDNRADLRWAIREKMLG